MGDASTGSAQGEPEETPLDRDELILVDRLWRSGTSATAVSPSTRRDLGLLQRFLSLDDRGGGVDVEGDRTGETPGGDAVAAQQRDEDLSVVE